MSARSKDVFDIWKTGAQLEVRQRQCHRQIRLLLHRVTTYMSARKEITVGKGSASDQEGSTTRVSQTSYKAQLFSGGCTTDTAVTEMVGGSGGQECADSTVEDIRISKGTIEEVWIEEANNTAVDEEPMRCPTWKMPRVSCPRRGH